MKLSGIFFLTGLSFSSGAERVLTHTAGGHLIHNSQVFSPDGRFVVFDSRNDETKLASSRQIGMVEISSGREILLYQTPSHSEFGPGVGAATFSPKGDEVVFIHGLHTASKLEPYAPHRRSAALVALASPGRALHLDARDVSSPFTPGASRGGTHAFHWSQDGECVSFTYNDAVLHPPGGAPNDLRTVGVILRNQKVEVIEPSRGDEFSGEGFTVIVVPVSSDPGPGQLSRACEEGWVGNRGYRRDDGGWQKRALAFNGTTIGKDGKAVTEVFIADLPENLACSSRFEESVEAMPHTLSGVTIRRLTNTENSSRPGLQGPRHWIRSSPDGSSVAFLDEDQHGVVQLFSVSPSGGEVRQISRLAESIETPFTWSPDGRHIATSSGGRIAIINAADSSVRFLTERSVSAHSPRYGVVFSPDGQNVVFNRMLPHPNGGNFLQICLVPVESK